MGRGWCFAAGLPVGALAGLALGGAAALPLAAGAIAGGVAVFAVGWARARGGRGAGVAAAAQVGWLALPAAVYAWLGVGPGAAISGWVIAALLLAALLWLGGRRAGAPLPVALLAIIVGGLGWGLLAGALAAWGAAPPSLGEATAAAIYDLDARVVNRPLPLCGDGPARVETLLERGAHPRLAAEGAALWLDAVVDTGRRQVHRLDLGSRTLTCFTCGEPGNNLRAAPSERGRSIVFESDRHANLAAPANTELFHMRTPAADPGHPSRRLTFHAGRDDHALVAPGGASLLWSRQAGGRFSVVSASFRTGHGALLLEEPGEVVSGGAAWAAPLAWSADARGLVSGLGNPLAPLRAELLDPATGAVAELGRGVVGVAFSADGARIAVVKTGGAGGLGSLPGAAGFLLGALPAAATLGPPGSRTLLVVGETRGELAEVSLGDATEWGWPTGVASSPDGTWLVVGQRRIENGSAHERLIRVMLDCAIP